MNRAISLIIAATLIAPASAMALGSIAPATIENLNGAEISFPKAFNGTPSLAILLFEHGQQEQANEAIALLDAAQKKNPQLKWVEFPLIGEPPVLVRFMIRDGMREAISEHHQAHVFPLFTEKDAWRKEADVGNSTAPLLAKLDEKGAILKVEKLTSFHTAEDILAF